MRLLAFLLLLGLVACGSSSPAPGDAASDSPSSDTSETGTSEAGTSDAPTSDAPTSDASLGDAPAPDDAPTADAADAPSDAPTPDASLLLCSPESDCPGACTGESCDTDWVCQTEVACTDDIVPYCGCDGVTFFGSSTCAPRPYQRVGACPSADGANCDRRSVRCRAPEPACGDGFVAEVTPDGFCWTFDCVAIGECACTEPAECPNPDIYTCRRDMNRCTPFL